MIMGKGTAKKKMPTNAAAASAINARLLSARLPIRITASTTIASTAALSPNSNAVTNRHLAPKRVDVTQRHNADDAGKYEQAAGNETADASHA